MDNIGYALKAARKARKLTQIELAEKSGISVNSLRLYEAGKIVPKIDVVERIAGALKIPSAVLYAWEEDITPQNEKALAALVEEEDNKIRERLDKTKEDDLKRHEAFISERHLAKYEQLTDAGKLLVDDFINLLLERPSYIKK